MKKSTAITIIVALSALLVFSFVPRMLQYLVPVPEVSDTTSFSDSTPEENSEPTYTRVEAERYEFILPKNNGSTIQFFNVNVEGTDYDLNDFVLPLTFNFTFSIPGTVGSVNQDEYIDYSVVLWIYGSNHSNYEIFAILPGEYGLYDLSDIVPVEGLMFMTPEPIYEYVLDSEDEGLYYERVEAERYEIEIPYLLNDSDVFYGCLYAGTIAFEDRPIYGNYSYTDEDLMSGDSFYLSLLIYMNLEALASTEELQISQGEYGRYVISETQSANEPVAFTFEPVYDYVLVD